MKNKLLKFLTAASIMTFAAGVVFAEDLAVKPETPPGQDKKTTVTTEKTVGQGNDKSKTVNSQTEKTTGKPEVKSKAITDFLAVKTQTSEKVKTRLGPEKFKDLVKNATESGDLVIGGVKVRVREMVRVEATAGAVMKRHAVAGVITGLGDNRIIISHQTQGGRVTTIYYNAATTVKIKDNPAATTANLAIGQRVAASGTISDGMLLANRIHVIPGKATGLMEKNPVATGGGDLSVSPTPASGSATPTATASPSATPRLEPTATIEPTAAPTAVPTAAPTAVPDA